jgi:large subunit ribosomal protein L21e
MAQKSSGKQQGSRDKLSKDRDQELTVNKRLKSFEKGQKATLKIEPSEPESRFHPRFHGKTGIVKGSRGSAYEVEFKDGETRKTLFVKPVHLEETEKQ